MRVWIDTESGTWGDADRLRVVDLTRQAEADTQAGEPVDALSLAAFLDGASDSEISEYGLVYGDTV